MQIKVNGVTHAIDAPPMSRLLDVLRENLRLTGVKEGCGEGECGACSVLLNGELVNSCLVPVLQVEGAEIVTIEGVAVDGRLHAVQQAFLEYGGAQCGICTPGMILAAMTLLQKHPESDAGANQGRPGRKSLPLHRLHAHLRSRSPRGARMRAHVPSYDLVAARDLPHALQMLAEGYRPIAGGTDVMVLFEAGKLQHKKWISIRGIPGLRSIDVTPDHITLGALTTYTDIRRSEILAAEFPLLVQAAALTGGIATQNRGTIGGNIVNASPAADTPPALLVYDAEVQLTSRKTTQRWVPSTRSFTKAIK